MVQENNEYLGRLDSETSISKERMSDEELGNLLAAIGNSEVKALLLSGMSENQIYTTYGLKRILYDMQGQEKGWRMDIKTPISYCQNCLAPIGLVAREVNDSGGSIWGYAKTEYGKKIGDALAGLLLEFSENHPDLSLRQLFGDTNSTSENRVIETGKEPIDYKEQYVSRRLKLYWELITSDLPLRFVDVYRQTTHPEVLIRQLRDMSRDGLISYKSREQGTRFIKYQSKGILPDKAPEPPKTMSLRFSQRIFRLLKDLDGEFSLEDIENRYYEKYPQIKRVSGLARLSSLLKYLQTQNYITLTSYSHEEGSKIDMSPERVKTIKELLIILDNFQNMNQDILSRGRFLALEIVNNPTRATTLLTKAKELSPHANKLPIQETLDMIVYVLKKHPNLTAREVNTFLATDHGRNIKPVSVIHYLGLLEKKGEVQRKVKNISRWSTTDSEKDTP